jgi:molecular chaperone GrpE
MENNEQKEDFNLKEETVAEAAETANEKLSEGNESQSKNETLKLQAEVAEQKDKFIRLYSEFENFRRRTSKEKIDLIQSANEQLIKALLPVIDDFDRAEKSFKDKSEKEIEGFFLIHNKFRKTLEQHGVKPMMIDVGADFDADVHEAITQIPVPDEKLKGKIVDVVEKGYLLNDKVIRFAKVVVGS